MAKNDHKLNEPLSKLIELADEEGDHKPLWDILVALRGPDRDHYNPTGSDDDSKRASELTNRRIRAIVGVYPPKGEDGEDHFRSEPLSFSEQKERDRLLNSLPKHYAEHYWDAVEGIRRLFDYDLDKEIELEPDADDEPDEMDEIRERNRMHQGRFGK